MSTTPDDSWRDDDWNDEGFETERGGSSNRMALGLTIAGGAVMLALVATLGVGAAMSLDHGPDPACRQAMLDAGYPAAVVAEAGRPSAGTCEVEDMCEAAILSEYNQATASDIAARMVGQDPIHVVAACTAPLNLSGG